MRKIWTMLLSCLVVATCAALLSGCKTTEGSVDGRLLASGKPVAKVSVRAVQGSNEIASTETGHDGSFRLDRLPRGKVLTIVFCKVRDDLWYMQHQVDVVVPAEGNVALGDVKAFWCAPPTPMPGKRFGIKK